MSALEAPEYTTLRVFVEAGARRTRLTKAPDGTYTATLKEPAQGGRANVAVRELIARHFQKDLKQVRILRGHRSRSKMIEVAN